MFVKKKMNFFLLTYSYKYDFDKKYIFLLIVVVIYTYIQMNGGCCKCVGNGHRKNVWLWNTTYWLCSGKISIYNTGKNYNFSVKNILCYSSCEISKQLSVSSYSFGGITFSKLKTSNQLVIMIIKVYDELFIFETISLCLWDRKKIMVIV